MCIRDRWYLMVREEMRLFIVSSFFKIPEMGTEKPPLYTLNGL